MVCRCLVPALPFFDTPRAHHTRQRSATLASELEGLLGYASFWALWCLVVLSGDLADAGARGCNTHTLRARAPLSSQLTRVLAAAPPPPHTHTTHTRLLPQPSAACPSRPGRPRAWRGWRQHCWRTTHATGACQGRAHELGC
jgi:hypothetical protein